MEEADHEPHIVVMSKCEQKLVERRLLLRRAVDALTVGGESQPLGRLPDFYERIWFLVTVEVISEPPQATVDVRGSRPG